MVAGIPRHHSGPPHRHFRLRRAGWSYHRSPIVATGVTLKGASNEEGNYYFPFLIPGMYRISAEKTGFKRAVRDQIELNVNARLELNLTLEVGAMAETITVTGEAPAARYHQRVGGPRDRLQGDARASAESRQPI